MTTVYCGATAFTIPLFKLLFGWANLINLNRERVNFPGIDLGDFENQVAIQVTSETGLGKVKDTLQTFMKQEYFDKFERLIIFMIQEKQKSYSKEAIDLIIDDKFTFNYQKDIIDLGDLLRFSKDLPKNGLEQVLSLFQDETGYLDALPIINLSEDNPEIFSAVNEPPFEDGFLNLIEIGFPDTLFIADWNFTKKELGTKLRNDRKLVLEALDQQGLRFAVDWVTTEKQIITFHDLGDDYIPLARIVDQGTVTQLGTDEFFENSVYRNKFIELLQRCLQQKLYHLGIQWQHDEKEYIFVPLDSEPIREIEWKDLRKDTRTVYRHIPNIKDNSKTYCHEHFAFETKFYEFNSVWYLAITPDWFYSTDGYKRAWYAIEDKRKYKKQVEANQNVATHVRFIQAFLTTNDPSSTNQLSLFPDISNQPRVYDFLWIKAASEVSGMPRLPDANWKPGSLSDFEQVETLFD